MSVKDEVSLNELDLFNIPLVRRRFREDDLKAALTAFAASTPAQSRKSITYSAWAKKTGNISRDSIVRTYGTFEAACGYFGIDCNAKKHEYTNDELIDFFEKLWRYVKRRPSLDDFKHYAIKNTDGINYSVFVRRFGSYKHFALEFSNFKRQLISKSELIQRCKVIRKRPSISLAIRFQLIEEAGGSCQKCGKSPADDQAIKLEIDHIVPFSIGGSNEKSNLRVLCNYYNRGRSNKFKT